MTQSRSHFLVELHFKHGLLQLAVNGVFLDKHMEEVVHLPSRGELSWICRDVLSKVWAIKGTHAPTNGSTLETLMYILGLLNVCHVLK